MVNIQKFAAHRHWPWLLAVGLAALVYANTLNNGFTYDDTPIIVNNPTIRSLADVPRLFLAGYWDHRQAGLSNYRPLFTFTLAVDYALWGLRPVGYHLTNLLLHAANTAWVWWLLRCYRAAPWLALLAALVFAVHPVHTEAVANVVGRAELLGMCFGGLMWWSWVQARRDTERAGWWRALAAVGYLAAMLSKENMVVLPAALWLAEVLRARHRLWRVGWSGWWATTRPFFWLVIPWLPYTGLRLVSQQGFQPTGVLSGNPMYAQTLWERLVTMAGVSLEWYRLVFLGFPLKPWYDAHNLVLTPVWSWRTVVGGLLAAGLVAGAVAAARRFPLLTFAVGFWFITLALVSNVVVPIWTAVGERWLYVPSVAYAIAVSWALVRLGGWTGRQPAAAWRVSVSVGLALVLFISYAYGTSRRNLDWQHDRRLFSRFLETDPQHPLPYTLLAQACQTTDPAQARAYYEQALARAPDFFLALLGLAQLDLREGRIEAAQATLARMVAGKPPEVVPTDADWGLVHALYARTLALHGDTTRALEQIAEARRYGPRDSPTLTSCAIAYVTLGQPAEAETLLREALNMGVDTPTIRFNLGAVLLRQGRPDEAERHFEAALRLDPAFAPARLARDKLRPAGTP
ncbi:tetratricopeptide repeat protein [Chloracidobacterium sp. MS 40/45]|uniref:tetratricopeptide repeat protein n=1 Tax=Chloracidobacterium aggregatum TaxID=2851959 RepID=UPI001B8CFE2F|nr:tetratricopeptide repeat protein [Chloracidobacterium aggregatum]QUV99782.1 tetratricopeptide repeat protein [Chloracidobacterium sp. MS 40/45]